MRLDLDKERQEVALLSEKNSDLYQNLTRKEDEINLATRTIGELRAQIIDLQGAIEEQADNYQTVKNRLDNLSQEKFTLEGTIRRLERELEDTRVSKESKIEILERLNNSMRETIGKQTIEMNTLQISERKLSVDLKTIDAVNARLSRSLEEANNAIARMDTERKANNAKIKKTEQESKTLQNQVDLLNDQLEVLKAKISQAQAMNIDLQKTANESKEKSAEGEERMRVEIAMLKGSVESLRKERDTQAREITNLRNIISEMSIVGKAVIEGGSKAENVIRFNADDKKGNKGDEE
jgi:chromosome segregation ATPase